MNNLKKFLAVALLVSSVNMFAKQEQVVVDVMRVSTEATYFKDKEANIKLKLEPEAKVVEAMVKDFQKKVADFQSKASTMSDKKKQEEGSKLAKLESEIKEKQQSLQVKAQSIMGEAQKELFDMVGKICKKLGFKLVTPVQGAVYVDESINVTNQIVAELNKTAPSKTKVA